MSAATRTSRNPLRQYWIAAKIPIGGTSAPIDVPAACGCENVKTETNAGMRTRAPPLPDPRGDAARSTRRRPEVDEHRHRRRRDRRAQRGALDGLHLAGDVERLLASPALRFVGDALLGDAIDTAARQATEDGH